MAFGSFNGLRVLSLENRRATEIAKLIRTYGGEPTVACAMREVPLESNHEAFEFAGRLLRGDFDLVIFTTGIGVRRLMDIIETRYDRARIIDALRRAKLATRGPKASAAVRELGLPVAVTAPEPCTWRETIEALDNAFGPSLEGLRAAVQEYGAVNVQLLDALSEHHVQWMRVPVYQWALPDDLEPLQSAIRSVIAGEIDIIVFLTAVQATHLFVVAGQMELTAALRAAMHQAVVLSIGPSTSAELSRHGIEADFVPSHPKMGFLMNEASECAARLLEEKRGPVSRTTTLERFQTAAGASSSRRSRNTHLVPQASSVTRSIVPPVADGAAPPDTRQLNAIQLMHDIGRRMAASDPLHAVLNQIVSFIPTLLSCDSCFVYVLDGSQLVLRASKNPHPDVIDQLGLK
ncbi:MAG TPA: uroporphyrinogen-III synthase, partial [Acidobacteriaceae bacterium]